MQAVILSERALGDTDGLFTAAVAHIARKLGRVKPLDADALPADRAGQLHALDQWAGSDIDWRGELIRFYEDHIPLHLRPNPGLNAALRAQATKSWLGSMLARSPHGKSCIRCLTLPAVRPYQRQT
jgi:hypothetical protein